RPWPRAGNREECDGKTRRQHRGRKRAGPRLRISTAVAPLRRQSLTNLQWRDSDAPGMLRSSMKIALLFLAVTSLAFAQTKLTFDQGPELPAGWKTGITGSGAAKWEVVRAIDASSAPNVLRQSGEATFCWAAKTDVAIKDGFAEVKFKPVSGRE